MVIIAISEKSQNAFDNKKIIATFHNVKLTHQKFELYWGSFWRLQ